jgi:hypothetical protein
MEICATVSGKFLVLFEFEGCFKGEGEGMQYATSFLQQFVDNHSKSLRVAVG